MKNIRIEIIDSVRQSVLSTTIMKNNLQRNGLVFAAVEELAGKPSPFDNYIQIIDGAGEIIINAKIHKLTLGMGIIIPAHARHAFNAEKQFKMISTVT